MAGYLATQQHDGQLAQHSTRATVLWVVSGNGRAGMCGGVAGNTQAGRLSIVLPSDRGGKEQLQVWRDAVYLVKLGNPGCTKL
jgi:hypothetical protein